MGLLSGVNDMNIFLTSLLLCLILFPIGVYFIQKSNLNYYKLNGRQPIEIECWLKTRKWYFTFIENIKNEVLESHRNENGEVSLTTELMKEIDDRIDYVISGQDDKMTISNAFLWMTSLEGTEYWGKREYEFLKWYFGQYIDLHLMK